MTSPAPGEPRALAGDVVLAELEDDRHGRLSYRGGRFLLIRPETLAALQRELETALGEDAAACLMAGGRAGGGRATQSLAGDGEARVAALCRMGTSLGWGEFALEDLGADHFTVTVRNSALAEAYGASTTPVCHLLVGVLESLAASVLATTRSVAETACVATGAPLCRFEAGERV